MKIKCQYFFKATLTIVILPFICGKCFEDEGIFAGNEPATFLLSGSWKLEKVITPSGTFEGSQIGYVGRMEIAGDSGYVSEKTYRNDSLFSRQYWGPYSSHIIDEKTCTYLMKYRYGLKRFFKVYPIVSEGDLMEASGYVSEIGAPEDTVRYFYKGAH